MSHPDDWPDMRACVRLTREIFAQKAFDPYRGREILPGADCVGDEAIDDFVREHAESAYHPSGACKMGSPSDPLAVVDPETRVIGVEALRVVDSSIMPSITNGNLNAPTIMIGEKAADLIRGRDPLPASNAPFYRRARLGDAAAVAAPACGRAIFRVQIGAVLSQCSGRTPTSAPEADHVRTRRDRPSGAETRARCPPRRPRRIARMSPFPTSRARFRSPKC